MQFPTLPVKLHDYQDGAVSHVDDCLTGKFRHETDEPRQFITSPTGSGKSYMILASQKNTFPHSWVLTPKVEIISDMLRKLNVSVAGLDYEKIVTKAWKYQITTPIRFRNAALAGRLDTDNLRAIYKDEGHHSEAESWKQADMMLPGDCWQFGFSATYFRGTPAGTAALHSHWGTPYVALTYPEAMRRGFLSMPTCRVWPLINDDTIELGSNGEFVISKLTAEVRNNVEHMFRLSLEAGHWKKNGSPARPTLIGVPSSGCMPRIVEEAERLGLKVECVTDQTGAKDRQFMFEKCRKAQIALVHINVVSEGIDLPIRLYIDLASCMSPLLFMQRFGRATRPVFRDEMPPEYICCNHNLSRHCYLLDGCLPLAVVKEAQTAFGAPSERGAGRVFGIQSLGRLHGFNVGLTNGIKINCYAVTQMQDKVKREYFVILHPLYSQGLWFTRENKVNGEQDGKKMFDFAKWKPCKAPGLLEGFKSVPPTTLSEKQQKWWNNDAERYGVEPSQQVDAKRFQILPVLANAKVRLT